jgi:hypothetical protein
VYKYYEVKLTKKGNEIDIELRGLKDNKIYSTGKMKISEIN